MARIQLSALVSDIRGKIGGTIFQGGQGGLIIRNNTTPVNKNSQTQNDVKNATAKAQSAWLNLTDANREAWKQFSLYQRTKQKNNKGLILNGHQYFIRSHIYFYLYSKPTLTEPSFTKQFDPPITGYLQIAGALLRFFHTGIMDVPDEYIILSVSAPVSPSLNNPRNFPRLMIFATVHLGFQDITTAYESVFGAIPTVGDTVFLKYTIMNLHNGFMYPFSEHKNVVI